MRKGLLSIVLITLAGTLLAQERSYIVSPSHTIIETTNVLDDLVKYSIYQENKTEGDLLLGWGLIAKNIPTGWDYSLCDFGTCYPGIPDGDTMDAVPKGEKGFLAINIYPYGIEGTASVTMTVWDVNVPSIIDTLTWIITVKATVGIASKTLSDGLSLYPNPTIANSVLEFDSPQTGEMCVTNMAGIEMLRSKVIGSTAIELPASMFSPGEYFISFIHSEGVVRTTKLIKQ